MSDALVQSATIQLKDYAGITFDTLMISCTLSIIAFFFGPYMIGSHMRKKADNNAKR